MKMKLYIEKQLEQEYLDQLEPYYDIVCNEVDDLNTLPTGDTLVHWKNGHHVAN